MKTREGKVILERFLGGWNPPPTRKSRQSKSIERQSDAIGSKTALAALAAVLAITSAELASAGAPPPRKPIKTRAAPKPAPSPVPTPAPAPTPAPTPTPAGTDPQPVGKVSDWFPQDSYPPSALRRGEEGRTVFALDIDEMGRITSCHVVESSGVDVLDSTTCTLAIINGRFKPARDGQGRPVAGRWRSAMRWQLNGAAPDE